MFCSKCGNEILEGEKFCSKCGTAVQMADDTATKESGNNDKNVTENDGKSGATEDSKKKGWKLTRLVITVLIVLMVAAGGVFLAVRLSSGKVDTSRQMVYLENEKLYYLKDMTKPDKAIQVARIMDMEELEGAAFDSDGKYLYYYSDVNKKTVKAYDDDEEEYYEYEEYSYTLSRIKVSKLKENGSHDKYVERIADGVTEYHLEDNGVIYYTDYKNRIIRYEDGKETDLKKDVKEYHIDEEKNVMFYSEAVSQGYDEDDLYSIGYVNMETGEDVQIDKDINNIYSFSDKGYYVYWKHGENQSASHYNDDDYDEDVYDQSEDLDEINGASDEIADADVEEDYVAESVYEGDSGGDIYVADGLNEPVRIAKDAYTILSVNDDGVVYYEYEKNRQRRLYEFVNDTHAEEDEGYKEPEVRDCLVPMSEDEVFAIIMTDGMKEEYLTGKKKDKNKFYDMLEYDDVTELYYYCEYFYDMESEEDETFYYYDKDEKQWYLYDTNKYEELESAYEDAFDRIELRRYLKTQSLNSYEYDVCRASASLDEEIVAERVSDASVDMDGKVIMYSRENAETSKTDIESLLDTWFGRESTGVYDFLQNKYSGRYERYYRIDLGEEQKSEDYGDIYVSSFNDNSVVFAQMDGEKYNLYYSEITDGSLTEFKQITDDSYADGSIWIDGTLYYYENNDTAKTISLCKYENGESTVVRENTGFSLGITSDSMLIQKDTDLEMYDMSGQTIRIARDVSDYTYLSRNLILYTSDGDLYLYTPDDSKLKVTNDISGYLIYMEQKGEREKVYKVPIE